MKLAAQENLVPGGTFEEKVRVLKELGYEGVELRGDQLSQRVVEIRDALRKVGLEAACVCGGYNFGLLAADRREREESMRQLRDLLSAAGEVGAQGVIVVPIFGPPKLPDLAPWKSAREMEDELLAAELSELAEHAASCGAELILEPLNRYETHYLNRVDQAMAICERINSPHMTILADVFHMNIEEADLPSALRAGASRLGYVHLADSNRLVPGLGHTDFRSLFTTLQGLGYRGWMSLECGVPDGIHSLRETLDFLRKQIQAH